MTRESAPSLDERYLRFRDATAPVFAAIPELETCRFTVFKGLLVRREGADLAGFARHWVRRAVQKVRHFGPLQRSDVLVWVESPREVVAGALLPVHEALLEGGVSAQIVALNGPPGLPGPSHEICGIKPTAPSAWCGAAWDALTAQTPGLRNRELERAFRISASSGQALLDQAAELLDVVRPRAVVNAATNLPGGSALVVQARRRGIRSFLLQHGIPQAFYTPMLDDVMFTWGSSSSDTMRSLGAPAERLVAAGSPRHDSMRPREAAIARTELCRSLNLPSRPTLVFFSNGNDLVRNEDAPRQCAEWLATLASRHPRLNVVVRLHPNEDGSLYARAPGLHVVKGVPDLTTTLAGCDVGASLCSTVLYEALLFRKPVWQFHAEGWPELAANWREGLAARVESAAQLSTMAEALTGGTMEAGPDDSVVSRVFANHGQAAKNVANQLSRYA